MASDILQGDLQFRFHWASSILPGTPPSRLSHLWCPRSSADLDGEPRGKPVERTWPWGPLVLSLRCCAVSLGANEPTAHLSFGWPGRPGAERQCLWAGRGAWGGGGLRDASSGSPRGSRRWSRSLDGHDWPPGCPAPGSAARKSKWKHQDASRRKSWKTGKCLSFQFC